MDLNLVGVEYVYPNARDGGSSNLKILLSSIKYRDRKKLIELLEHKTKDGDQITTPLIIASRNGHLECVKILLSYNAKIEAKGTVKFDNKVIEEATALWAAASKGALDVVKCLVNAGANVNAKTKTNSTPLRTAAYWGHIDIVSYLVKHEAEVNAKNAFDHTPLMIACYKGHKCVVTYLVQKGAELNVQDSKGYTAWHYAVEGGHIDIVKYFVKNKVLHPPNKLGLTPLLLASNLCKIDIVEYLITNAECSQVELINSLELLGATLANDKDAYNLEKAYHFMLEGMKRRYHGNVCIHKKVVLPPIKAYQEKIECQTLEEISEIQNDPHAIHMEGLIIRERILKPASTKLRSPIIYRGVFEYALTNFELCILLLEHAMDIGQQNDINIRNDIKFIINVFCHMIQRKVMPGFVDVLHVFECSILEYDKLRKRLQTAEDSERESLMADLEYILHRSLYLLTILTRLKYTENEEKALQMQLSKYLCLDPRTKKDKTLLHLAVSSETVPTGEVKNYTKDICVYPCLDTTKLLLQTGAHVGTNDESGNTPLHTIAMMKYKPTQQETIQQIIDALLEAGAHFDLTNKAGKTPLEVCSTVDIGFIFKLAMKGEIYRLECITARAVKKFKLRYSGVVPKTVEMFINAH